MRIAEANAERQNTRVLDIIIAGLIAAIFGLLIFFPLLLLAGAVSGWLAPPGKESVMPVAELLASLIVTLLLCAVCFRAVCRRLR